MMMLIRTITKSVTTTTKYTIKIYNAETYFPLIEMATEFLPHIAILF